MSRSRAPVVGSTFVAAQRTMRLVMRSASPDGAASVVSDEIELGERRQAAHHDVAAEPERIHGTAEEIRHRVDACQVDDRHAAAA